MHQMSSVAKLYEKTTSNPSFSIIILISMILRQSCHFAAAHDDIARAFL